MNRLDIAKIWEYNLRKGSTDHPRNGACLFDAGMWLVYGKIGDDPPCSCPVIRAYAIRLNDRMPDDQRQRLKPFILRVVGNRDSAHELERMRYLVIETARRIVPLAYECRWPEIAAEMRAIPDDISYGELRAKLLAWRKTAVDADAAAYATAYATATAWAAWAAWAAYATATADAAWNITATAYAATAGAATDVAWNTAAYATANFAAYATANSAAVWDEAIAILDGVLRIGKRSPELDENEVRAAVRAFERARSSA